MQACMSDIFSQGQRGETVKGVTCCIDLELAVPLFLEDAAGGTMQCDFRNPRTGAGLSFTLPLGPGELVAIHNHRLFRGCSHSDRARLFVKHFWSGLDDHHRRLLVSLAQAD